MKIWDINRQDFYPFSYFHPKTFLFYPWWWCWKGGGGKGCKNRNNWQVTLKLFCYNYGLERKVKNKNYAQDEFEGKNYPPPHLSSAHTPEEEEK